MAQRQPKPPLKLSGRVYCDWSCFTMLAPRPDRLQRGDLLVWSWSGNSKKPNSNSSEGLLRVLVFDGKKRRTLQVKRTKLHGHLRFQTESERERRLSALLPELRALRDRELGKAKGGFEVAPLPIEPEPEPTPASEPTPAPKPVAAVPPTKPVQGALF